VAACLAAGSFLYAREWVSEERLWAYTLARNPDAWLPHVRLGMREFDRGEVDAALPRFRRAEILRPDLGETKNMLGAALLRKGRYDEARVVLEEGLEATTFTLDIRANLAAAYCQLGRLTEARDLAEEVMRKQPATASLLTSHGIALCGLGERERGIAELKSALGIDPDHEPAIEALRNVTP
jgi:Flp pilus assembly protein TadD